MDEQKVREHAEGHAGAMQEGNLGRAAEDLSDEVKAKAGDVLREIPRNIDSAEVLGVSTEGDDYVADIRYSGEGKSTTVRSRWQERDGRPLIVDLSIA